MAHNNKFRIIYFADISGKRISKKRHARLYVRWSFSNSPLRIEAYKN